MGARTTAILAMMARTTTILAMMARTTMELLMARTTDGTITDGTTDGTMVAGTDGIHNTHTSTAARTRTSGLDLACVKRAHAMHLHGPHSQLPGRIADVPEKKK